MHLHSPVKMGLFQIFPESVDILYICVFSFILVKLASGFSFFFLF